MRVGSDEWHAWRRAGIGGSELGDVFNDKPDGCARRLWYAKLQVTPDYPAEQTSPLMRIGQVLEARVRQQYMLTTGRRVVRKPPKVQRARPWERVNIDGEVTATEHDGKGVFEVKCHQEWLWRKVQREGPKAAHLRQLMWGMYLWHRQWGAFAIANYSAPETLAAALGLPYELPLVQFDLTRDEELVETCVQGAARFWTDHIVRTTPPPPLPVVDGRCERCAWRRTCRGAELAPAKDQEPLEQVDSLVLHVALGAYRDAKAKADEARGELDEAKAAVVEALGGLTAAETEGARVYHRAQTAARWDTRALEHLPALIQLDPAVDPPAALKALHEAGLLASTVVLRERYKQASTTRPLKVYFT
jgi:predicted phage-related endonuclease